MSRVSLATLKNAWRVVRKVLLWSSALLAVVVVTLVVVNAADETLSADAQRLLTAPVVKVPPEQNLYVYLAGFQARAGGSPLAVGQERIAQQTSIATLPRNQQLTAYQRALGAERLDYRGPHLCDPLAGSCWAAARRRSDDVAEALDANLELYQRYLYLHTIPRYDEGGGSALFPLVAYVPPKVRGLFLANVAVRVQDASNARERARALDDLRRDIATWRRVLTGEPTLVSALVAAANLHGDLALIADMAADGEERIEDNAAQVEAMLGIVADGEWKIPSVFATEYRFMASVIGALRDNPSVLLADFAASEEDRWPRVLAPAAAYFLKTNATLNVSAEHTMRMQKAASTDAADYLKALQGLHDWRERHLHRGLHFAYNPIGKTAIGLSPDIWDGYPLRVFDVASFQRLVRLGYEIRKRRVASSAIAAFMREQPALSTHPVSGEAFVFDAATHEIAMKPLGAAPQNRRFKVPVWRSP